MCPVEYPRTILLNGSFQHRAHRIQQFYGNIFQDLQCSPRWLSTQQATAPSVMVTPALATQAITSLAMDVSPPTPVYPLHSPACQPTVRTRSPWPGMECHHCRRAPPSPALTAPSSQTSASPSAQAAADPTQAGLRSSSVPPQDVMALVMPPATTQATGQCPVSTTRVP